MTASSLPLAGRTTVVTGASRGIGAALVRAFLDAGARSVVAVARSGGPLHAMAAEDGRVIPVVADLGLVADCEAAFAAATERGPVDAWVNNHALGWTRRSTRLDGDQLDELYEVNLRSTTLLSIAAAAHMAEHGGGSIVNVSSITATSGAPLLSAYAATKGAIDALGRSLAAEWGSRKVRVNTLSPGVIETDIWAGGGDDPKLRSFVEHQIPLGRWGQPADIAGPAVFLASDASRYVTGHTLTVDGGMTTRIDLSIR